MRKLLFIALVILSCSKQQKNQDPESISEQIQTHQNATPASSSETTPNRTSKPRPDEISWFEADVIVFNGIPTSLYSDSSETSRISITEGYGIYGIIVKETKRNPQDTAHWYKIAVYDKEKGWDTGWAYGSDVYTIDRNQRGVRNAQISGSEWFLGYAKNNMYDPMDWNDPPYYTVRPGITYFYKASDASGKDGYYYPRILDNLYYCSSLTPNDYGHYLSITDIAVADWDEEVLVVKAIEVTCDGDNHYSATLSIQEEKRGLFAGSCLSSDEE